MAELPFGAGKPFLNNGASAAALLGGWQVNGLFGAYSGTPFTVESAATSLDMNGSNQMADQVKETVEILGGIGPGNPWFDTTAFRPVTERRFGTAGFNSMRGPGYANFDMSVFRQFALGAARTLQFRLEIFNLTNTPHFANPIGQRVECRELRHHLGHGEQRAAKGSTSGCSGLGLQTWILNRASRRIRLLL